MFYVYTYLREDGTPYYVGKGKGNRARTKGKHERVHKPTDTNRIIIVEDNLLEQDAFALEIELIKKYGRKDIGTGILQNQTDGGDGVSGAKFGRRSNELIEKIASANRGQKRSAESRAKMAAAKIGTKQSDETKKKRSESLTGIKRSDEYKKKLSESRLGEANPMYGKESPRKGKTMSESAKEKIRQARAKQVISAETKLKMAESQRRRHAARKINEFLK